MNVDQKKLQRKPDALIELLRTHASVFVHVDTRVSGCMLPEQLLGQPQVAFQLGSNLVVPVQDLVIHENGWGATLTFGSQSRTPAKCIVPWKAVFLIVGDSGFGASWPLDTPPELLAKQAKLNMPGDEPTGVKRTLPKGWKVIEGGKKPEQKAPEPPPAGPHTPRGYRRPGPEKPVA